MFSSPSGKRLYPRFRIPARLEVQGGTYTLRDWSLGGAAFEEEGPSAAPGDLARARLLIGDRVTIAAVWVGMRVLRVGEGQARAIQFIEIAPDDARLLDRLTSQWLDAGERTRGAPITAKLQAAPARRHLLDGRTLGMAAVLALGFGLLLLGGGWVVSQRMVVYSDFAAVSQPMRVIRASQAGTLAPLTARPGTALREGQPIATLTPVPQPQILAELGPRQQAAEARLRELDEERAQARAGFENFRLRAEAALRAATSNRQFLERQVTAQERVFQRLLALSRQGILSQVRADQEEVLVLSQRRALAEAQSAELAARQALEDAAGGRFVSDGRMNQRSPADIEREARAVVATRDELRSTLAALSAPVTLTSPCDCTVAQVTAAGGAFVVPGEVLLGLAEQRGIQAIEVDALVPSGRMAFLRLGQPVRMLLGGDRETVTGRIAGLDFNPENSGRIGLADNLRSLKPYGLVTVALDAPVPGARTGLPALLVAPIEFRLLLQQVPGLSWLVTEHRDAPAVRPVSGQA